MVSTFKIFNIELVVMLNYGFTSHRTAYSASSGNGMITWVSFPRIDDAILILIEKRNVLLKNAHAVVPMTRSTMGVLHIRSHQSPCQIWIYITQIF